MTIIKVRKLDESFLYVTSDFGIEQEMYEYFSFMSPGAKFDPRVRNRLWDGKIRLYSQSTKKIHVGLFSYIEKFAKINDYQIQLENEIIGQVGVTYSDIERFVNTLNIHSRGVKLDVRDYQLSAIYESIKNKRIICISPTGSGKSLILYAIIRWYIKQDMKCLIIVPSTMLVDQMFGDFSDYSSHNGWNVSEFCSRIYSGMKKDYSKECVISTWQTLQYEKHIPDFDVVCGDECIHPSSLIKTIDGDKPISEIKVGDMVLTLNESTHETEFKPVLKLHNNISISEKKYKVKFEDGSEIIITGNHKMFTNKGWQRTDNLKIGDLIKS